MSRIKITTSEGIVVSGMTGQITRFTVKDYRPATAKVHVKTGGPKGDKGDTGEQGVPGVSGGSYVHIQATASSEWTVVHNLGYYPNVTVKDSTGRKVMTDIQDIDINSLKIISAAAFAGSASLS